jgi:hypothetical protein
MRLKSIAAAFAAIVFAFAVVACNDDDDPTTAPTEAPAAEATEAA